MHADSNHPGLGPDTENHPGRGYGIGGGLHFGDPNNPWDPTDPAWGDVLSGIWDRLTHPRPR